MARKPVEILTGTLLLLLSDIIRVVTTRLIGERSPSVDKPFFVTYIRTSCLSVYLLGVCLWPCKNQRKTVIAKEITNVNADEPESSGAERRDSLFTSIQSHLSDSVFVPVKIHAERSSGTESDDSSVRSVRFNKLAEVRHMSTAEASEALFARLSYSASVRFDDGMNERTTRNSLPVSQTAESAFVFCVLWFFESYSLQLVSGDMNAHILKIVTASLATLFLAAMFPVTNNDRLSVTKFIIIVVSTSGMIIVSPEQYFNAPENVVWALISAILYSTCVTYVTNVASVDNRLDVIVFFGLSGIFTLVLLWPLLFLLHFGEIETFVWPDRGQWIRLLVDGVFGFALSKCLWLCGCLRTSSLTATVALTLQVPITIFGDVVINHAKTYSCLLVLGTIPIVVAFVTLLITTHYDNWDPCADSMRLWCHVLGRRAKSIRLSDLETEQSEALIGDVIEHEA